MPVCHDRSGDAWFFSRLRIWHRLLVGALASVTVLTSCGLVAPGTATHDVYLTNGTSETLTIYELQRGPGLSRTLGAGASVKSSWPYPLSADDHRRARLEVDDSNGTRVYCSDFTWDDLNRLRWEITILKSKTCDD